MKESKIILFVGKNKFVKPANAPRGNTTPPSWGINTEYILTAVAEQQ